jgi:hypothetical protein
MNIIRFISYILCLLMLSGSAFADDPDLLSDRYISLALQGDLSQAESLFSSMNPDTAQITDVELAVWFRTRFIEQSEDLSPGTGDAFTDAVVSAYRNYWILTLMGEMSSQEGEDFLESSLHQVLSRQYNAGFSGRAASVFELIGDIFDEKGVHYLDTPAPPLRDLFLWKTEQNRKYSVRLTDRTQKVSVTFINDMYSMGWKQYATLGLVATTGWVEDGHLYCVERAYDRGSENFEVSYLKHEGRHLVDFEHFPELQSADLEYRAKLTELVFASTTTRQLLDDFTSKSAPNPASPHAHANYRVTREVYREMYGEPFPESGNPWQEVSTQSVSSAARNLLQRDTEIMQAGGQ